MSKNMVNIANRLITTFMFLVAAIAFQNSTVEDTNQVLKIRIEQQENKIITVYRNSDTEENKSVF